MHRAFPLSSVWASTNAAKSDDRRLPRDRTAQACTIVHGMYRERHQGVVRDIHERGARIRPDGAPESFQGRVELIVADRTYKGKIVWRSRTEMGIQFDIVDPLAVQAFSKA